MSSAHQLLADDDDLRVGVVFAHGDHFSAGLDLTEVGPARIARDHGVDAAQADLVERLGIVMASEDAAEGVASFVERREASFTGR